MGFRVIIFLIFSVPSLFANESFLLINGVTSDPVMACGPQIHERISPCSTFKITLSLMGFDAGILEDEHKPVWDYQEGYDDWNESWKGSINPALWMNTSCLWYSKVIAETLTVEKIESYLSSFSYGNQDMSGGLDHPAWITSSLTISPKEQVDLIQKMISKKLPISDHAIEMTKALLFKEALSEGWNLYGKTGWSGSYITADGRIQEHGWFVGWIESGDQFYPFAYLIQDKKLELGQRIPRVKQLLNFTVPHVQESKFDLYHR